MNKKGLHQAFMTTLKAPLSLQLDRSNSQLTIHGSEQVIKALSEDGRS